MTANDSSPPEDLNSCASQAGAFSPDTIPAENSDITSAMQEKGDISGLYPVFFLGPGFLGIVLDKAGLGWFSVPIVFGILYCFFVFGMYKIWRYAVQRDGNRFPYPLFTCGKTAFILFFFLPGINLPWLALSMMMATNALYSDTRNGENGVSQHRAKIYRFAYYRSIS